MNRVDKEKTRKEWVKAHSKLWIEANEKMAKAKQRRMIASRKSTIALSDRYIKQLFNTGKAGSVRIHNIPQELIEVKRLQILINRRIKDEKCNATTK
jgi:hypothetical protein